MKLLKIGMCLWAMQENGVTYLMFRRSYREEDCHELRFPKVGHAMKQTLREYTVASNCWRHRLLHLRCHFGTGFCPISRRGVYFGEGAQFHTSFGAAEGTVELVYAWGAEDRSM
eukprot:5064011-Amphidinium_carterae.1